MNNNLFATLVEEMREAFTDHNKITKAIPVLSLLVEKVEKLEKDMEDLKSKQRHTYK